MLHLRHEENTHAYCLEDDVAHEIKQERANEIMKIQSRISWELNQKNWESLSLHHRQKKRRFFYRTD